ncbi:MAG: hypothetical protein ACKO2L_11755, partial [Planctomycetaceae bacterium]
MRLTLRLDPAVGRKPPAVFRTEGARAVNCLGRSFAGAFARRLPPNGLDFLAGGGAGRAKLLLSRIPAARTAAIPAASQNRGQSLTAR